MQGNADRSKRTRLARFMVITAILVIIGCIAGFFFAIIYPYQQHRYASDRMETAIMRLALHRPAELTDDQWAYCIVWTWNLHSNWGVIPEYMSTADLNRIVDELDQRIDDSPDIDTIDWIWDQYATLSRSGGSYDHFRPTALHNRAEFEMGAHGGNPLSWWREEYQREISQRQ